MNIVKTKMFEFEGQHHEIRVVVIGTEFKIAVFLDGKRANGYTYSAEATTNIDMKLSHGVFAYEHLMEVAESDVRQKYWEKYLEARSRVNADGKLHP
jgi:hypothetical protein